jgi:ribonuclease HII
MSVLLIAGVDEVGRGTLAGPVVAAAVVFEPGYINPEIKDSKKLSEKKRDLLCEVIKREARQWAIVAVGPRRIERLNIHRASLLAMSLALQRVKADKVLVDGPHRIYTDLEQEPVIGGDSIHVSISAASIIAKVWRDRLMCDLAQIYVGYGFEQHVGYATPNHKAAIAALGPSPIHRATFAGVREHVRHGPLLVSLHRHLADRQNLARHI